MSHFLGRLRGAACSAVLVLSVGDSIVETYPAPSNAQGWGAYLPQHFPYYGVTFVNDAFGGTSSKSFIDRLLWVNAIASHPQFVFIEFGTNDALSADPNVHTDPDTFRANLHRMIADSRAVGAEPILVTPPVIRIAGPDGFHVAQPNGLEAYVGALQAQAAQDGVGVVDLSSWSRQTYDAIGVPQAQATYGYSVPNADPNLPPTPDVLHFNPWGAAQAANEIAAELPSVSPNLAYYLVWHPVPVPGLPGAWAWALALALGALSVTQGSSRFVFSTVAPGVAASRRAATSATSARTPALRSG
jgi:lysophospholipase L1-like esterase